MLIVDEGTMGYKGIWYMVYGIKVYRYKVVGRKYLNVVLLSVECFLYATSV
jgi:hypothetical protein